MSEREGQDTGETQAEAPRPKRIIKRYSNRKLYDTRSSRYVKLAELAELLRQGEEFTVVDNSSKEDLTQVTLAQILYEEQKTKGKEVPLQSLRDLIQSRTEKVLSDLREGPIGRLIPAGQKKGPGGSEVPKAPAPPPEPQKPSLVDQAKGTLEDWQHKIDERIRAVLPTLPSKNDAANEDLKAEIKRLQERVDALEAKLK